MKNFFPKKLLIQVLLFTLIPFSITFAQTGCYVRDGGRELYSFTDGSTINVCGVNAKVYTASSIVPRGTNCQWTPAFPVGSYSCVVMPFVLCGIEGSFVLECSLDNTAWVLVILSTVLGIYILRRYPETFFAADATGR